MRDQYDTDMVARYDESFTLIPLRRFVELPSVFQAVGGVAGRSILDLACGTGYYANEFRRRGASRVVGVDVSEEMHRATRAREERERLGVEYLLGDAGALEHLGNFHLVTGIHLLHYATSSEHLKGMCEGISRNLRSGGRFIGYQLSHDICRAPHYYDKYCFNVRMPEEGQDGQPFTFSVTFGEFTTPEVIAHYWSKKSLESALRDSGLTDIRWVAPVPSPEGIEKQGADFWADLTRRPFELIVTCRKP